MKKFGLLFGALILTAPAHAQQPRTPAAAVPAPATLQADHDENRGREASVIEITELRQGNLTAKIYGTAGGDPAMNGLYTYLAFWVSTAEGHRVFMIGDFNSYEVYEEAPGRVVLQVDENYMDAQSEIQSRSRRITISWQLGRDDAPPTSIRIVHEPIE